MIANTTADAQHYASPRVKASERPLRSGQRRSSLARRAISSNECKSLRRIGDRQRVRRARSALGLSTLHISPRGEESGWEVTVWGGGELVELHRVSGQEEKERGGKRGVITGFSAGSRRRMQRKMAALDAKALLVKLPLEAGLTYHYMPVGGPTRWKRHRDLLTRRIMRACPDAFLFWRLEFQTVRDPDGPYCGVPHYHLLIFNVSAIPNVELSRWWYEIAGQTEAHRRAGTHISRVRNRFHARAYVSKYVSKVGDLPEGTRVGRIWGIDGKSNYDRSTSPRLVSVSRDHFYRMRRCLARKIRSDQRSVGRKYLYRMRGDGGLSAFLRADLGARLLEPFLRPPRECSGPVVGTMAHWKKRIPELLLRARSLPDPLPS